MENWTVKSVDGVEPQSAQEQETAVVEEATADNPNVEIENNEPIQVNLDEPVNQEADANREEETENVPEEVDGDQEASPLELVNEQEQTETEKGEHLREDNSTPQSTQQESVEPPRVLPEDVDKLIAFMEETGGSVSDYARLNRDLEALSPVDTIKEYYREKYPHMSEERIERKMNKSFLYDEDADEADAIQDKKDLFEDELYDARNYLQGRKDKYYSDLKLRREQELSPELKEASDFYNEYKATQESNEKLVKAFQDNTNKVFNDEFKGFDFKVGDAKYRFKVQDAAKVREAQLDLNNFINEFTDDSGAIADAAGYHKALFAARNADKLAQHFYEQGRADAVRQAAKESKNIDMKPRSDASAVVTPSGNKVRVVSGDSSNSLRFKMSK